MTDARKPELTERARERKGTMSEVATTVEDYDQQQNDAFFEAWAGLTNEQRFSILRYFKVSCEICLTNRDEIRYDHTTDDHANFEPGP